MKNVRFWGALCCLVLVTADLIEPTVLAQMAPRQPAHSKDICTPIQSDLGIHVGCPKIYQNRELEERLTAARRDLEQLRFLDQSGIAKQIGAVQGGTATESSFGLQLTGSPTPQIATTNGTTTGLSQGTTSTLAPTGPTTSTTSTTTSGTTGSTTITQGSLTPTAPSPATLSAAANLSAPSLSSLGTLNEQLQLTYEVANLQLLLEGSLSDHFIGVSRMTKQRATIGFPISIEPPTALRGRDAVAEVQVTVTADRHDPGYIKNNRYGDDRYSSRGSDQEPPGLVAILPRERTYNTAHITDNQKSFAGAAVLGVFGLGLTWMGRTKTFFLLQDQDTVALERGVDGEADPAESTSFGWQFRPVLNQPSVSTGLRQTFVQMAFPVPPNAARLGTVKVVVRWREYHRKMRSVGKVLTWWNPKTRANELMQVEIYRDAPLTNFDLKPFPQLVNIRDVGQGRVSVQVLGDFLPGSFVRLGESVLDEASNTLVRDPSGVRFVAPAASLVAFGASLVGRDGTEAAVRDTSDSCRPGEVVVRVKSNGVSTSSFSDDQSLVTVQLDQLKFPQHPIVVLVGDKLFGLSDAPLRSKDDQTMALTFVAPTALLRNTRHLKVADLQCGDSSSAEFKLSGDFTATKLVQLSSAASGSTFAVMGTELAHEVGGGKFTPDVTVYAPNALRVDALSNSTVTFTVSKEDLSGLKQVLVVPAAGFGQPVSLSLAPQPSAPAVKTPDPIVKGPARPLTLFGSNLDAITAVQFQGVPLIAIRSLDNTSLTIDLPEAVTMHTPSSTIDLITKDRSTIPVVITVLAPNPV